MELRPELQIKTAIKAILDVVLPAVDPNNKLAQEQTRLVIGMLSLAAQQLPLMFRYERDELSRFLALAERLQAEAHAESATSETLATLKQSAALGADVLERARAESSELQAANFSLRAAIGDLIESLSAEADSASFKRINQIVTAHAKEQLLRERSLLLMQGWETDPASIPAIETLIGAGLGTK